MDLDTWNSCFKSSWSTKHNIRICTSENIRILGGIMIRKWRKQNTKSSRSIVKILTKMSWGKASNCDVSDLSFLSARFRCGDVGGELKDEASKQCEMAILFLPIIRVQLPNPNPPPTAVSEFARLNWVLQPSPIAITMLFQKELLKNPQKDWIFMRIREGWFSTAITGRAERIRMGNKWERARVTRDAVNTFQIKQTHKKKSR